MGITRALLLICLACSSGWAEASIRFASGNSVLTGDRAGIRIEGVVPASSIRLHAFRLGSEAVQDGGAWVTKHPVFHAWADYRVSANGAVDADREAPLSGSFSGPDARGFFWSGYRAGSAQAPLLPGSEPSIDLLAANTILFALEQNSSVIARQTLEIKSWNPGVQFTKVETPEVSGYFAAPAGASKLPVIITLHGSEGGSFESAKRDAGLFASHGYATLSLIYFAWEYVKVNNVPVAFDNLPLERIDAARQWLKTRPEADTGRLGIRGVSKGSEFGLLAAADYPWVKALAACVPTSVVWGAFGTNTADGKTHSGFTRAGKPLANVAYGDYAPWSRVKSRWPNVIARIEVRQVSWL